MAKKINDLRKMSKSDREKELENLKVSLVKSKINVNTSKTGGSKTKEIKKMIARIHTLNKLNK